MGDTQQVGVEVWERLTSSPLYLDQTDARLGVEREQVERFYLPLALTLLSQSRSVSRLMVAVAGPPGSGKTAFATILVAVINAAAGEEVAVLVGLDGWHYPNDYLESHALERDGERMALRSIKGAPETFDAAAAYDCLAEMRQGGQVSFPVYSRRRHEPVPGGGMVTASHRIVVVEGNYLLLDEEPWRRFRGLFDVRVFISASLHTLVEGLRERHRRGGKSAEVTEQHMQRVDLPNIERVLPSAARAHLLVHKADVRHIERLEWVVPLECIRPDAGAEEEFVGAI
ncbi:MAG: nucleoside/nucleotide kinase family protein [Anaerolineae bacterium]|nr:nucleoside/nucleotide kinase family protein [Anaerolineae bacterium]